MKALIVAAVVAAALALSACGGSTTTTIQQAPSTTTTTTTESSGWSAAGQAAWMKVCTEGGYGVAICRCVMQELEATIPEADIYNSANPGHEFKGEVQAAVAACSTTTYGGAS